MDVGVSSMSCRNTHAEGSGVAPHQAAVRSGPYSFVEEADVADPLGGNMLHQIEEVFSQEASELDSDSESETHHDQKLIWIEGLPWWRRPHPNWLLLLILLFALSAGIVLAPRLELYLALICDDMGIQGQQLDGSTSPTLSSHIPTTTCRQSPIAQRRLSFLQLLLLVTNGIGAAFSAGPWAKLSDRKGRLAVLAANIGGICAMDVVVLIAATFPPRRLPFGIQFLAIGSTVEGLFGGYSAVTAMSNCYLSDVTPAGTRSNLFSLMTGALFAGIAIGPTIGGLLTTWTGDLYVTLIIATIVHVCIFIVAPFIPESLSPAQRKRAQRKFEQARAESHSTGPKERIKKAVMEPLRSLDIIFPHRAVQPGYTPLPDEEETAHETAHALHLSMSNGHTLFGWDMNMLLVSIAFFLESATIAIVPVKIQYVQLVFNWNSEMIGYFMSFTALTRMLTLVIFLPLFIKFVHLSPKTIVLPQDERRDILDAQGRSGDGTSRPWDARQHSVENQWMLREKYVRLIHDSGMDHKLAIGSAFLTAVACIVTARSTTVPPFLLAVMLTSLGAGVGSAVSSLGLSLLQQPNDAGRLFGAWAVLGTTSSSIIGPLLFTSVFSATAATRPSLVFYVITGTTVPI